MTLKLDHTFCTADFLNWYHHARVGETCDIVMPVMDDWRLRITTTADHNQLILHPDENRSRPLSLDDLLHMLESLHRAMSVHAKQSTV